MCAGDQSRDASGKKKRVQSALWIWEHPECEGGQPGARGPEAGMERRHGKMETLLVVVLVVFLLGGGGWGYSRWRR